MNTLLAIGVGLAVVIVTFCAVAVWVVLTDIKTETARIADALERANAKPMTRPATLTEAAARGRIGHRGT